MAMQKIMTNALLLLSLVALTACPDNSQDRNNIATPQAQTPPPGSNIGGNPANGLDQLDTIMKTIQCEFEGVNGNFNSKTNALFSIDSRVGTIIDLKTKFLGFDIGKFGKFSIQYVPAAKTKSGTDTINLMGKGLNKQNMSQTGFAGQLVKLEALGESKLVTVSCKSISPFKSGSAKTGKTNLVCSGHSSTAITAEEEIRKTILLNSIQVDEEIELSKAVRIKVDSKAETITYMGNLDVENSLEITSMASLKSPTKFMVSEQGSSAEIEVLCKLE